MRNWIIGVAAAIALLASGPALADDKLQLPAAMPTDLDLALLTSGDGVYLYMTVPASEATADGQPLVWMVIVWDSPFAVNGGKADYAGSFRRIDCSGRRMQLFGSLLFDRDGKLIARQPGDGSWMTVGPTSFGETAVRLACGEAPPSGPTLHGLSAALADVANRRRSAN